MSYHRVVGESSDLQISPLLEIAFEGQICVAIGFPGGASGDKPACQCRDVGSIPRSGRFPGGGHGNPLQYSYLENPMDKGSRRATVLGVTKSQTQPKWLSMHAHVRAKRWMWRSPSHSRNEFATDHWATITKSSLLHPGVSQIFRGNWIKKLQIKAGFL